MGIRNTMLDVFHPSWVLSGIGIGLGFQFLGVFTGFDLLAGLSGFFLMGIVVGWASPGSRIVEPGVAAFLVASVWFVLDHLLLTLMGLGLVGGAVYGGAGLVLGVAGGWLGEQL